MINEKRDIDGRPFMRWTMGDGVVDHWRLQGDATAGLPEILCGKCERDLFRITFGDYECIATCAACGHSAVVYDG